MKTFLFYDVETSGLNPAFDQILTFACIRTDTRFSEISRETITIRLRRDIIPSPHACITHCLVPEALENGLSEYEAAKKLHILFNTPDTISIGYNSLSFDDEFLRFLFYRNLLDPYTHQYANGCSRADMLPVAALYKVFAPDVILWPFKEDGQPSLKLEHIASENRFETSGRAHEAMADVEALVALCRAFSLKRDVWDYSLDFFSKNREIKRMDTIAQTFDVSGRRFPLGIMVSGSFGGTANYLAPVIHLGDSIPYKNQGVWLRLDREDLFDPDEETGVFSWFTIRKKTADQWIVLPCLDRFWQRLAPEFREMAQANMKRIQEGPGGFLEAVYYYLSYTYPHVPDIDPDADLYQSGFFSFGEKKEMSRFHDATDNEKPDLYETLKRHRVKVLSGRILARNFEITGIPEFDEHMEKLILGAGSIKGYRNDVKFGLEEGKADLLTLKDDSDTLDLRQKEVLSSLEIYLTGLETLGAKSF